MITATRKDRRALKKENSKYPDQLKQISLYGMENCVNTPPTIKEVWRSKKFLVQIYFAPLPAIERLSICRSELSGCRWTDGITWDEIQRLKAECGRGDKAAVEIFPPDHDIVDVANMRHIWILDTEPEYMWRKAGANSRLNTRGNYNGAVLTKS